MRDDTLSCSEARLRMTGYLNGEPCAPLAAHLVECPACLEACMEAALRRPAEVRVPRHFREQVLARVPAAAPIEARDCSWVLVTAASLFAALGAGLLWSGALPDIGSVVIGALARPAVLAAAVGIETTLSLLWMWRVMAAE
jgi:hypothetical protein